MTKLLETFYEIMNRYKNGDFGDTNLTMYEILEKANEADLLERMSISEIDYLNEKAYGITKLMFNCYKMKKQKSLNRMVALENELESYEIEKFCDGGNLSDSEIANKLKLDVRYLSPTEMPVDVEATLSVPDDKSFLGQINISNAVKTKFPYMHEIIHYFKDVGVGNRVPREFTRKIKGKTETPEEQDINYLTAATVMPVKKIAADLEEFEKISREQEREFLIQTAEKYGQDMDAVLRRFTEVHILSEASNINKI